MDIHICADLDLRRENDRAFATAQGLYRLAWGHVGLGFRGQGFRVQGSGNGLV